MKWLEAQTPPPRAKGAAKVAASFAEGSAVLAGEGGDVTLVWDPKARAPEAPPGTYRVRSTRIVRESWIISASAGPEPSLTVKDKAELKVDETVRFDGHAKRHGAKLQLGFSIKAADGRGLTVYKDDRRVPVTFKVLAKDGKVLAQGTMNYG